MIENKYFKKEEIECKCCGELEESDTLMLKLVKAREDSGVPFNINSGYRCERHNANVGGVKGSSHTKGYAVDIAITSNSKRYKILTALIDAGFNRIGVYKTFIHVDVDPTKPSNVIWFG